MFDGGGSGQNVGAVKTQTWSAYFKSATTHTVATVTGDNRGIVVIARIDWAILYSYAGDDHAIGTHLSSTRRSKEGEEWVTQGLGSRSAGSTQHDPTITWTDGVLTLKTKGSVQCTAHITLTYHTENTIGVAV